MNVVFAPAPTIVIRVARPGHASSGTAYVPAGTLITSSSVGPLACAADERAAQRARDRVADRVVGGRVDLERRPRARAPRRAAARRTRRQYSRLTSSPWRRTSSARDDDRLLLDLVAHGHAALRDAAVVVAHVSSTSHFVPRTVAALYLPGGAERALAVTPELALLRLLRGGAARLAFFGQWRAPRSA